MDPTKGVTMPEFEVRMLDGRPVAYRPDRVIARSEAARDWVVEFRGDRDDRGVEALDGDGRAWRIRVEDPLTTVEVGRGDGLAVQLDHVFFSHCCGCGPADPCCCGGHPSFNPVRFNPVRFNPVRFNAGGGDPGAFGAVGVGPVRLNPVRFNPVRANTAPQRSTAIPAPAPATADPVEAPHDIDVWILDTGLGVDGHRSTWLEQRAAVVGDPQDHPDGDNNGYIDPVAGHGTFIAGVVEQLVPGCNITVRRVMGSNGQADEWDIANVITELLGSAPRPERTLINLSFGGQIYDTGSLLRERIAQARRRGAVVVASAGNDATCVAPFPARFEGVIAVGALDADGEPAEFTNYGSWVDASAPGVDLLSSFLEADGALVPILGQPDPDDFDGWAIWSGTSFAAPTLVAVLAKVMLDHGVNAIEAGGIVLDEARRFRIPCLGLAIDLEDFFDAAG
jgi:subtilisin family serine protease